MKTLENLVSGGDFCLVGNADSESYTKNGLKIDSYKEVIRINNFRTEEQFIEDYGGKTTIWAHSFCPDVERRERCETIAVSGRLVVKENFKKIICPYPLYEEGVLDRYAWVDRDWLREDEGGVEFISNDLFHELLQFVPNPSTGMLVLYWVNQYYKVKEDQLFGFNHFNRGEPGTTTTHYWGKGIPTVHDGEAEYKFLKSILR